MSVWIGTHLGFVAAAFVVCCCAVIAYWGLQK